ncbi:hypothetical protein MMC07_005867 [Pseudocyphellaria aurata]|nr:hypothetical protein [Pseudocyphellaria aurata]
MEPPRKNTDDPLVKQNLTANGDEMVDEDIAMPSTLETSRDINPSTPVSVSSPRLRNRHRGRRASATAPFSTTKNNGASNSSALPADWQSTPSKGKGKGKAGPTSVQDDWVRQMNSIDLVRLDESIRILKWKDYSAIHPDAIHPDLLDESCFEFDDFDDGSDYYDSQDMVHVNLVEQEPEQGDDVFTTSIHLDEDGDLDSLLLDMVKEEEKKNQ